jgi:hypothetical protein
MKALAWVGEGSSTFFALFPNLEQAAQAFSLQRSYSLFPLRSPHFPMEYNQRSLGRNLRYLYFWEGLLSMDR